MKTAARTVRVAVLMSFGLWSAWGGVASPAGFVEQHKETAPESGPDQFDVIRKLNQLARQGDVDGILQVKSAQNSRLVRTTATLMLAGFRGPDSLEALTRALDESSDLWIRTAAVQALAYLGGVESESLIRKAAVGEGPDSEDVAAQVEFALERAKPGNPVAYATVMRGTDSARGEPGWVQIDSEQDWHTLWAAHRPEETPPEVDFASATVLAFFQQVPSPGGAGVEITQIEEKPDFLRVLVRRNRPNATLEPGNARLSYHIVKIPKTALPVHWVQMDRN